MERRLAAILAADVVGYGRLMAADEAGTHAHLKGLLAGVFEPAVAGHGGRIVKLTGDGVLAEFASAVEAVSCAVEIQTEVERRQGDRPDESRVRFRIGINIGDVMFDDGDIYGDGVIVAARLEPLAEPGGIWVSRTVHDYTRGKIGHAFESMGAHRVKNLPEPVEAYRVVIGDTPVSPRRRRQKPLRIAATLGALALAALAMAVWLGPWREMIMAPPVTSRPGSMADTRPSLAVLPFDNLSSDAADDYFADGLTDDLITDLSKITGLTVIARNTVFAYKGRAVDIGNAAQELGVRYVLEGSVRRAAGRVRINAQLIDSRTGGHLWAERFDREASDIFALQDEVIRHIVDSLSVTLTPPERNRVERLPTESLEAYDYYLRAQEAARSGFRPRLGEALALYAKATSLDPNFARAFAAQARVEAYIMRNNYDDILAFPVARKRAYEHAGRALEIDPDEALPFAVLAVLQTVDRRHEEALASARRAVEMAPGEAETHAALSFVQTFAGDHEAAIGEFEMALRLNPRLPVGEKLVAAMSYMLAGQPDRAVEVLEASRFEAANVDDYQAMLSAAYAMTDRMDLAHKAAATAARLGPNLSIELMRVTLGQFRRPADLTRIMDALKKGGVQRWPFGFDPGDHQPLPAKKIEEIAIGATWRGQVDGVGPGILQIASDGTLAIRTVTLFATGRAFVSRDTLCAQYDSSTLGRPMCGPIYSNGQGASGYAYTYVNGNMVFRFSPRG